MKSFDDERYIIYTMIDSKLEHCHCACSDVNDAVDVARKLRDSFRKGFLANPSIFEDVENYAVYDTEKEKIVYICGIGFELF